MVHRKEESEPECRRIIFFKAMYGKDKSFFCNVSFFKTGRDKERSVCLVMAHSFSLLLDTEHSAFTKISQIDTW